MSSSLCTTLPENQSSGENVCFGHETYCGTQNSQQWSKYSGFLIKCRPRGIFLFKHPETLAPWLPLVQYQTLYVRCRFNTDMMELSTNVWKYENYRSAGHQLNTVKLLNYFSPLIHSWITPSCITFLSWPCNLLFQIHRRFRKSVSMQGKESFLESFAYSD